MNNNEFMAGIMSIIVAALLVLIIWMNMKNKHKPDTHYIDRLNQIEDAIIDHNKQWEQMPRSRWVEIGDSLQRQKRLTRDSLYLQIKVEQPKH